VGYDTPTSLARASWLRSNLPLTYLTFSANVIEKTLQLRYIKDYITLYNVLQDNTDNLYLKFLILSVRRVLVLIQVAALRAARQALV
jgi:hypothetical protein